MLNVQGEKEKINNYITAGIQEILYKGLRIDGNNLGNLEDEMNLFMRALQIKNKVHDYAVLLEYDTLFGYKGKIAYSLINSEEDQYQDMVEFKF